MDTSIQITFFPSGIRVKAAPGAKLPDLMDQAGIFLDAPCGGRGTCGKCAVLVNGQRMLACRTELTQDSEVELLSMDSPTPPMKQGSAAEAWTQASAAEQLTQNSAAAPVLYGDSLRLSLSEDAGVSDSCSSDNKEKLYLAAFDIGTTTVAGYLVDGSSGKDLASAACLNPQARYGADVISRISAALRLGTAPLTSCIRSAVNELLAQMCTEAGIRPSDVRAISVVGNTCMHHLFLGISPASLARAPFLPEVTAPMTRKASGLGITAAADADLYLPANIAGFIGGDTVACLTASRLAEEEDWTLLVDIGTNGEIVLGCKKQLTACSAAAGPAFEGALISCGMRAVPGAISHARLRSVSYPAETAGTTDASSAMAYTDFPLSPAGAETSISADLPPAPAHTDISYEYPGPLWELQTVGNEPPCGICGSGLLDVAAELLRCGLMDETGYLEDGEVLLADETQSGNGRSITLTQKDIRQLQLAKGAIAAGIRLLAQDAGISLTQIRRVLLAGAFGTFLSPESACAIGLIPPVLSGRVQAIGNAAGEGAKQLVLSPENREYARDVAARTRYLELANLRQFQEIFAEEMLFPESAE